MAKSADDAVLVLRLGLAVNALRAQQRFSHAVNESPGPAGARDRVWAFIQAVAFTREGLNILSGTGGVPPQSVRVKELATLGEAPRELSRTIGKLQGGTHPASPLLARVRNKLAFHWDPELIAPWVAEVIGDGSDVVWMEGIGRTNSETIHRAASDALVSAIMPEDESPSTETKEDRFRAAIPHVASAMDAMAQYFECAVRGYMHSHGGQITRR